MTWDEFYDKTGEWSTSTIVRYISKLENMGPTDEIIDVFNDIAFYDEKGATRLINRAIQFGVTLSGEQLDEIYGCCSEGCFNKMLELSAPKFTTKDLDDLYCTVDGEKLVAIALKYKIKPPKELLEDYAEEFYPEIREPEGWEYENYIKSPVLLNEAAKEALRWLYRLRESLAELYRMSALDAVSEKRLASYAKYVSRCNYNQLLEEAGVVFRLLNDCLRASGQTTVDFAFATASGPADMLFDRPLSDYVFFRRVKKTQRQVDQAIVQVRRLIKDK